MNAGEFGRANNRTTMGSSSNTSIAKKARTKAEADFATWLMMAKLGGFDDLPSNAQSFLTNYRTRLEMMSEAFCGKGGGVMQLVPAPGIASSESAVRKSCSICKSAPQSAVFRTSEMHPKSALG
jgi:hypothetical protein